MKRLLPLLLGAFTVLLANGGLACEKHLNGHQNSSDSSSEAARK